MYKPGNVSAAPAVVAPHQPRLDWQLWFAALGPHQSSPWFSALVLRLLQGQPDGQPGAQGTARGARGARRASLGHGGLWGPRVWQGLPSHHSFGVSLFGSWVAPTTF